MPDNSGKRLLLIAHHNSYRIAPYIRAARNMGLEVTIASQGEHSLVSEVANGIHVDFADADAVLREIIREHKLKPFAGILGSDDQTVELAARAARQLSLPHNPPQAARFSHRKDLARAQLSLSACPVPLHCLLDLDKPLQQQLAGLPWPCVVKPLNMSASRGVIRANNEMELIAACQRLRPILAESRDVFERRHVLLESYIDGTEIAYEGFLQNGKLETITIFDKPDPLTGPFFEETIYVTPSLIQQQLQHTVRDVIQQACDSYGLVTGAVHAECRIDQHNKVWILEVASRTIGGDCARMLDSADFNIEELAITLAVGQPVSVSEMQHARGVMMIPIRKKGLLRRVEGLLAANRVANIDKIDIVISEGHELIPLPEGNQYLGYIFASADTPEQVTAAIRQAYAELDFITAPVFKITSI